MNQQRSRILQDHRTALAGDEVLARAKRFFQERMGVYSAFLEKEGPSHAVFRGQGGEELVIGVSPIEGGTLVSGSTYLFDVQVLNFFTTLEPYVEPPPSHPVAELPSGSVAEEAGEGVS